MGVLGAVGTGRRQAATAAAALLLPCAPGAAATGAGTRIENVASLTYGEDPVRVSSNAVALTVDELLDVAVAADHDRVAIPAGDAPLATGFVVANPGNGTTAYTLAGTADRDAVVLGLAADIDGDGVYDPGKDSALTAATITLASGERRRIFVLLRAGAQPGTAVSLSATATKGHGTPGTVLPGAGTAGADAVIGRSGASATASTLLVDGDDAAPRLDKYQSVVATDGSARARPGAIITYRLEARFAGPAPDVTVTDAIPAGTVFVPGSITLDGQPLTDAADSDAATFDGSSIRVGLGDIAAAGLRTIRFQTRIQ